MNDLLQEAEAAIRLEYQYSRGGNCELFRRLIARVRELEADNQRLRELCHEAGEGMIRMKSWEILRHYYEQHAEDSEPTEAEIADVKRELAELQQLSYRAQRA